MRLDPRSVFAMLSAIAALMLASLASAQERAGVVTTLQGNVTVARASSAEPTPLKFRDDVFVRDRIATGKESFARVLLGGRAVVTIREFSAVTITEVPGVATVDVGSGRVAVAVARERMRPGDLVEVRTPNAVAGIRGTVIVAEVFDAQRSVITVLKGVIDVTHLEAGRVNGPAITLSALQQVTVDAAVSVPHAISTDHARRMREEFRATPPRGTPLATTAAVSQAEVERVTREVAATRPSVAGNRRGQTEQSTGNSDVDNGLLRVLTTPTTAAAVPSSLSETGASATVSGSLTSSSTAGGGNWTRTLSSGSLSSGSLSSGSLTSGTSGSGSPSSGNRNNGNGLINGIGGIGRRN